MDEIDLEVQEMLKKPLYEPIRENSTKLEIFVEKFRDMYLLPLRKAIDVPLELYGARINTTSGFFTLFTENAKFYGMPTDNCAMALNETLGMVTGVEAYHEQDGFGHFFYIFPKPINFRVVLEGKFIFKYYNFEVL